MAVLILRTRNVPGSITGRRDSSGPTRYRLPTNNDEYDYLVKSSVDASTTTDLLARCTDNRTMCTTHRQVFQRLCVTTAKECLRLRTTTRCGSSASTTLPTITSTGASTSVRSATSPSNERAHFSDSACVERCKSLVGVHAEHAIPNPSESGHASPKESRQP